MRAYDNPDIQPVDALGNTAPYTLADNITVGGINDSTYDAFPVSTSYMQGGFAPSQPIPSVPQQPVAPSVIQQRCMRVMFSANQGFSAYAYWTDCSGKPQRRFLSVGERLEVDALEDTASGLPTTQYPIGYATPIYDLPEQPSYPEPTPLPPAPPVLTEPEPIEIPLPPAPPVYVKDPIAPEPTPTPAPTPLPPAPPVLGRCYKMSVTNSNSAGPASHIGLSYTNCCTGQVRTIQIQAGETYDNIIADVSSFHTPQLLESNVQEFDCSGTIPEATLRTDAQNYATSDIKELPVSNVQTATPTPELPTQTSKDLKPYILAGIAIVGILIAAKLMSKK